MPLMLPVPRASRVTLTLDLPSVIQSVAVWRVAESASGPVNASAPAAAVVVFRNSRREWRDMGHLVWADKAMVIRKKSNRYSEVAASVSSRHGSQQSGMYVGIAYNFRQDDRCDWESVMCPIFFLFLIHLRRLVKVFSV